VVWLSLRLVKFIGLMLLGGGLGVSLLSQSGAERMRAACWLTGAGMLLTWCAGYGMVQSTGRFIGEPFILVGLAFSLLAHLDALLYARRPSARAAALTVGGACGAVAVMVLRPVDGAGLLPVLGVALGAGILGGFILNREAEVAGPQSAAIIRRWFVWLARLEGLSLLTLLVVVMPLKYLGGLYDGGWTGWIHGALFMQYGLALLLVARAEAWGWGRVLGGVVAGLLPGGTFVFEVLVQPDQ
jgi:integral membrane protein